MRKCTQCGKEQPLSEYYQSHTYNDGYATACKTCHRKKARENWKKKQDAKKSRKRKNYINKNIYLKVEGEERYMYYFIKPDNCMCEDVEGECMYCYLKSNPIKKEIEKRDEDFWDERTIKGISFYSFEKKINDGAEVINF